MPSNDVHSEELRKMGWFESDDGDWVYGIDDHWALDSSTAEILESQIKTLVANAVREAIRDIALIRGDDIKEGISDAIANRAWRKLAELEKEADYIQSLKEQN